MAVTVVSVPLAWGAAGELDPSFSGNGKVTTDLPSQSEQSRAVVVDDDGSVFAAGYAVPGDPSPGTAFVVVKYTPEGELDDTFSDDGYLNVPQTGGDDVATAITIQPDNSLLVAGPVEPGGGDWDFGVVRVTPGGAVDESFGEGGLARIDFGHQDYAFDLGLDPSGRIVVAGAAGSGSLGMTRLLSEGTVDGDFGDNGQRRVRFRGSLEGAAVLPNGGVLGAGARAARGCESGFGAIRVRPNGELQSKFSKNGRVVFCVNRFDEAQTAGLFHNGDVLLAGQAGPALRSSIGVARLTPEGKLNDSFSEDGIVTTRLAKYEIAVIRGAMLDGGKPVIAGYGARSGRDLPFVARYTSRGALDGTFAGDGLLRVPFQSHATAWAIAKSPNRRAVISGGTGHGHSEVTVARFKLGNR